MNDQEPNEVEMTEEQERGLLFTRAKVMGITHSNNIGTAKLRELIQAKMNGTEVESEEGSDEEPSEEVNGFTNETPLQTSKKTLRQQIMEDQLKLVRVRITNMNPQKKDLFGEVFTVANGVVGTIRKFIPYGEQTANGYHIPYCIYKRLKNRKYLHIRSYKDKNTKQIRVDQSWVPEFGIEVLEPLTEAQLKKLAHAQLAAGNVEDHAV